MAKVFANGRSILHAGDGLKQTSGAPDVCKSPSPSGPVPVPYVNVASDSDLANGTKQTKIQGKSVALESSNLRSSVGDEPGTAGGGLVSAKTKGKLTWGSASANVKFEGKGVVRFMDTTHHNGNSFNTAFISLGGTGFAYADDFDEKCCICDATPDTHAILERPEGSLKTATKILNDLKEREKSLSQLNQNIEMAAAELKRLRTGKNPVKPETLVAREAALASLEAQVGPRSSHRRSNSSGYMFGVLICINGKKFAAVSGDEMPPGFKRIAISHGCTPIEGPATLDDLMAMNPRCTAGNSEAIDAMTKQWQDTMDAHEEIRPGYNNRPGNCAGAKLVGKSGHVADSMSEIFFSFSQGRKALSFTTFYRGPEDFLPQKGFWKPPANNKLITAQGPNVDRRVDIRRRKETTVPSCQSCQDTLFMVRCDLVEQSCG